MGFQIFGLITVIAIIGIPIIHFDNNVISFFEQNDGCSDPKARLPLDTACLTVFNQRNGTAILYSIVDECYECKELKWSTIVTNSNKTLEVSANYSVRMYYKFNNQKVCPNVFKFQQYGKYGWNLTNEGCPKIFIINESWDPYIPILAAFMIYVLMATICITYKKIIFIIQLLFSRLHSSNDDVNNSNNRNQTIEDVTSTPEITKRSTRIQTLDTFRGIAVLIMIFVNNGGGGYIFFNHSPWNGLTVADLVLPWFAWTLGFTLYRSIRTQFRLSVPKSKIILKCIRRSITLILLGLMINSLKHKSLNKLRFTGILQLLAISYLICSFLEVICNKSHRNFQYGRLMFLEDILDSCLQWIIIILITICRTVIVFLLPIPGCPTGYMGPGGYHEEGKYENCTAGAVGYIDRLVLKNHIYHHTKNPVYGTTLPYDPEGLLNIMGAVLIVYFGVQASKVITYHHNSRSRLYLWFFITCTIGAILCNFEKEGGLIPVNKRMMSLSYVLITSGFSFLLYIILNYLIDYKRWWSGSPFIYAGTNPIFLYVGHYVMKDVFPWAWKLEDPITHTILLTMNLWTTILWTIIAYYLYVKDIIITV